MHLCISVLSRILRAVSTALPLSKYRWWQSPLRRRRLPSAVIAAPLRQFCLNAAERPAISPKSWPRHWPAYNTLFLCRRRRAIRHLFVCGRDVKVSPFGHKTRPYRAVSNPDRVARPVDTTAAMAVAVAVAVAAATASVAVAVAAATAVAVAVAVAVAAATAVAVAMAVAVAVVDTGMDSILL